MHHLIHHFIDNSAMLHPERTALRYQGIGTRYDALAQRVQLAGEGMLALGMQRHERVAIYLEKREESVLAMFGAASAGCVFVPINPLLKPPQVRYILSDCNVRLLVTSADRLASLGDVMAQCPELRCILVVGANPTPVKGVAVLAWNDCMHLGHVRAPHRCIDTDVAALLYTSGSTGKPKGVVLSHRNMVVGAQSVASYLGNEAQDKLLSVLPLSFDYGLSQLTTAFSSGASVVLMNYLLPRDIVDMTEREGITGLACVPPLWIELAQLAWSPASTLRYLTNSGGAMPGDTVKALRRVLPQAKLFLMYGLTEAFRSTYLPPEQVDVRPDSIGKPIPNAEILVLRPDGSPCKPDEPGELVHRGPLVSLGYWNDRDRTAERFRPLANLPGMPMPETAVWSGDTVRMDREGYLYFIGRSDDMIKTSGYRVSPSEVEEVVHASGLVADVAAIGIAHPVLGQSIALLATAKAGCALDRDALMAICRAALPSYMWPSLVELRESALPRNPNGKIDRRALAGQLASAAALEPQ
jgi:acyl-CoA ligase (AMP-forming) (exosortase A-associated)